MVSICSACYIREMDTSRNYRYYPAESETATYEGLISINGGMGDKWEFCNNWRIVKAEQSADDLAMPKDAYKRVLDDLKELMKGETLYGLTGPENADDYNKHAEDLLDKWPSEYKLWANFGAWETRKISENDVYLNNLRVIVDQTKCYIIVDYRKFGDVDSKRYAYCSEDGELTDGLIKWADKYIESKSAAASGG